MIERIGFKMEEGKLVPRLSISNTTGHLAVQRDFRWRECFP